VASHAAVWAGLYIAGAVVCLAQVAGLDAAVPAGMRVRAAVFAFCTAAAVYLLDRAKLRDAWLDPADAQAHPRRYAFVAGHSAWLRGLLAVLLAAAAWLGWGLVVWGAVVPLVAAVGVLVYAGRPRTSRPRPKDVVLLKNVYVAAGITGFAALVSVAAAGPGVGLSGVWDIAAAHALPLAVSCVFVAVRVFADAVLCDLDDEEADRRFGTGTLPTHLGRVRAWNVALAVRLASAFGLLLMPMVPWPARVGWAAVTLVSSLGLRLAAPSTMRDWVDARFAVEAAVVAAGLALWRG
jgi:hypothetical protein